MQTLECNKYLAYSVVGEQWCPTTCVSNQIATSIFCVNSCTLRSGPQNNYLCLAMCWVMALGQSVALPVTSLRLPESDWQCSYPFKLSANSALLLACAFTGSRSTWRLGQVMSLQVGWGSLGGSWGPAAAIQHQPPVAESVPVTVWLGYLTSQNQLNSGLVDKWACWYA